MIRRSRISVRPNVKPAGRVAVTSQDPSQENTQTAQTPADLTQDTGVKTQEDEVKPGPSAPAAEGINNNDTEALPSESAVTQTDISTSAGDAASQSNTAGSLSLSGPQRRKRFTVLPNLAKPRTSTAPAPTRTSSRTPRSPVKAALSFSEPEHTAPAPAPELQPQITTPETRRKRRLSGGGRQTKAQAKPVAQLQASLETSSSSLEQEHRVIGGNESQSTNQSAGFSCSLEAIQSEPPVSAENPHQSQEPSSPPSEKQTAAQEPKKCESSERSQSSPQKEKSQPRPTAQVPLALRTFNDPMDRVRLAKAKKLRELLKREMNKDKQKEKHQRPKMGIKEHKTAKDHTKMTMRELIYYLPSTNPMKSYVEDEQRAAETVLPSSPRAAPPASPPAVPAQRAEEGAEEQEETPSSGTGVDEPLLAPRVKVAEDGSLIIDEESLTVEVLRVNGPNPAEERDPIFERGSTTTYSSFRKGTYTKPWSNRETDMFFLAISMVGTDFSMIGQLFPHRARVEIKNKFKKEERANSWRIDKAFKERRRLDLDFFNNLLEKILEEEKKRKKKKVSSKLPRVTRSPQRNTAVRKKKVRSSSGSEEESSGSDVLEGEKENEGVSNDGGSSTPPTTPRRKSAKKDRETNKADEVPVVGATEDSTAEGQSPVDRFQKTDLAVEKRMSSPIRPAQLKGRAQRPLPNLERKWRGKGPIIQKKTHDTHPSSAEDSGKEKGSKGPPDPTQEKEKRKTSEVISCGLDDSEDEDEPDITAVQEHILNKPTRSGRIPKLSQHVIRAAADEDEEEDPEPSSVPPAKPRSSNNPVRKSRKKPGPTLKKGMPRRGKSRLVTLRASTAEEEDDDDDEEEEYDKAQAEGQYPLNGEEEENQAFVPIGLRAQPPVHSEVVETMEELDISVNVPDVLGISQNTECPESSCERSAVPCEHQLDLLVDVIEFLAPEHMEVSEESYAEAARTLLTIGHSAHMTPAVDTPSADEDIIIIEEQSRFVQQDVEQEVVLETTEQSEAGEESCEMVTSDPSIAIISEHKDGLDSAGDVCMDNPDQVSSQPSQQVLCSVEEVVSSQETISSHSASSNIKTSKPVSPHTRRNRLPKPKPNLKHTSRPGKAQQKHVSEEMDLESIEKSTVISPLAPVMAATGPQGVIAEGNVLVEGSEDSDKVSKDIEQVSARAPAAASQPRSEGNSSMSPDQTENSVLSMERKLVCGAPEFKVCIEQERVEAGDQTIPVQQSHRVNESLSGPSVSESSVQPSQHIRRFRGPKPKPNLLRSSRTTHTHSEQKLAPTKAVPTEKSAAVSSDCFTAAQRPEELTHITDTNVSQIQAPQESEMPNKSVMTFHSAEELSGAVSKQHSSDTSETKAAGVNEEVIDSVSVEQCETKAEVISADILLDAEPTSEEPVYVLSLTEVPPTLGESEEISAQSETLSGGSPVPAEDHVSHLLLPDVFVPVSEEQEKDMNVETEETKEQNRESEVHENEEELLSGISKRVSSGSTRHPLVKDPIEQHGEISLISDADGVGENREPPAKRQKLVEKGRRAKLQVKPNPVQRLRSLSAKELSPSPSSEETRSTSASSQQSHHITESEDTSPLTISVQGTSVSPVDMQASVGLIKRSKVSLTEPLLPLSQSSSEKTLETVTQSVRIQKPPVQDTHSTSSHSTAGQASLPETKAVESTDAEDREASGPGMETSPVHQLTPLAVSGPLTRPGRRPRGFLSFMSSTKTQGSAPRGATAGLQKPVVNTSRSERRRAIPGPLTSAGRSAPLKTSTVNPSPPITEPALTPTPTPQVSAEPEISSSNPNTEEEPTSVSAYFFSDIFTMVDEQDEME
ncbi:transcription factor TFIIIB component B'' homolog [Hoplias malabaricus]|uniref:transcription factor TFIIIB component B'' homolog n=1 Tax=Hoplias malabaricus TaxID=27720 RepID=UPI003461F8B9